MAIIATLLAFFYTECSELSRRVDVLPGTAVVVVDMLVDVVTLLEEDQAEDGEGVIGRAELRISAQFIGGGPELLFQIGVTADSYKTPLGIS